MRNVTLWRLIAVACPAGIGSVPTSTWDAAIAALTTLTLALAGLIYAHVRKQGGDK